jgi:hypothetical protein
MIEYKASVVGKGAKFDNQNIITITGEDGDFKEFLERNLPKKIRLKKIN